MLYSTVLLCQCLFLVVVLGDTGLHASDDLHKFVSRPDLMPPKWEITYHDRSKVAPGYWFVDPHEYAHNALDDTKWTPCQMGPTIYDNDGELVWSGACQFKNRIVSAFGVAEYEGKPVLKGLLKHSEFPMHDCGGGFILNNTYRMERSVLVAGPSEVLNTHEFNMEGDGVIVTTGEVKQLPGKDIGRDFDVWVMSDGFEELDIETGEVLFEWNTDDHVSLHESSVQVGDIYSKEHAWDAFHTNSVTKNAGGDYLVSIRFLNALLLVSGDDGHIIWRLGGKKNDFVLEDDLKFSRQHHARYIEYSQDRSVISLFDNARGADWDRQRPTHPFSRGLILELSHKEGETLRARVLKQYKKPDGGFSRQRGSLQLLPNGNVLMAWTDAGYMSEHTDDDEVVMEARWGDFERRFGTYRSFKSSWVGMPDVPPDIKAVGYGAASSNTTAIYVSWNGATEYRSWNFYSGNVLLGSAKKTGFETVFLTKASGKVSAEALDSEGHVLGKSQPVEIDIVGNQASDTPFSFQNDQEGNQSVFKFVCTLTRHPTLLALVLLLYILGLIALARVVFQLVSDWRHRRTSIYTKIPTTEQDEFDARSPAA